jgi:hypothetical protein
VAVLFNNVLAEFNVFIRDTKAPFSDLWINELKKGSIDAFVALILAQAPDVAR